MNAPVTARRRSWMWTRVARRGYAENLRNSAAPLVIDTHPARLTCVLAAARTHGATLVAIDTVPKTTRHPEAVR